MNIDQRAVARGAGAYLAVAIPCGLIIGLIQPSDQSFLWVLAAVLVLLVAPVIGGWVASSTETQAPLTQAAWAVGLPAAAFLVIVVIVRAAQGSLTATIAVSFLLFLSVFVGLAMGGGYLAFRRRVPR